MFFLSCHSGILFSFLSLFFALHSWVFIWHRLPLNRGRYLILYSKPACAGSEAPAPSPQTEAPTVHLRSKGAETGSCVIRVNPTSIMGSTARPSSNPLERWLVRPGEISTNTVSPEASTLLVGVHSAEGERPRPTNVGKRRALDVHFVTFNCQYLNMDHLCSLIRRLTEYGIDAAAIQGTRLTAFFGEAVSFSFGFFAAGGGSSASAPP